MSTTDTPPRRGYHHGNLREALLDAARDLVAERGPQGFTLAEATRRAGVTPSAAYRHFKDREQLLLELCRRGTEEFGRRLGTAMRSGGLNAMGPAYLTFAREEPGYYAAMFSFRSDRRHEGEPEHAPGDDPFEALMTGIAKAMPAEGDAAKLLALEVWALSHGLASLERAGLLGPHSGAPPAEDVLYHGVARLLGMKDLA